MEIDPSALEPGTVLAGKFRVVRCLGSGGMGAVYEIEHELTKHRRALKMLHAAMAAVPGVKERFLREASAAGRVGNPHIAETFDAGSLETGEPYLVMEILRGETLTDRISRGKLPLEELVDIIGQACEGVHAAHEAGIVHRDLKPDNLFIIDVDGRPFVKILDFGISKFDPGKTDGMNLTQEGAALGTPYYMSPEQIRGQSNLDARADVYALGVILYECAAGQRPFEADVLTQLAVLIHTGAPTPLQQLRPELPVAFTELVRRAMATDREQRVGSAGELRQELENFGAISFKTSGQGGMIGSLPGMSIPPPNRSVAAHSMATSAAGVSVRQAQLSAPPAARSQRAAIVTGFSLVAALGLGFVIWRGHDTPNPDASGTASGAAPSVVDTAEAPAPILTVTAAVPSAAPPPSASGSASASAATAAPSAGPPPRASVSAAPFPVVAPTLPPPPPLASATPPPSSPGPGQSKEKPRRTTERGLAEDNPFR
jgi:serine/threonine protein kinase